MDRYLVDVGTVLDVLLSKSYPAFLLLDMITSLVRCKNLMMRSIEMEIKQGQGEMLPSPSLRKENHKQEGSRIKREKRTVLLMLRIYCHHHHTLELNPHSENRSEQYGLCPSCAELLAYAWKRLTHCRFGERKTTCERCGVHCYKQDKRDAIKLVMREVGPKMLVKHPIVALRHVWDNLRAPEGGK
ncbi:nitrous oxide-stimulated promoter family protein [Paenibacillus sp. UNC217MF]|uniref:nitrous oxide-stimulated promoter family protein n=1 Tax=Paenibacillus sp. UNC217MF TaxID=1449062 RepID=UPI00068B4C0C|nr:nitrous oxide-stimulated promoter family protein [Paenibacillus sp. UNC217MF]